MDSLTSKDTILVSFEVSESKQTFYVRYP